MSADFSPLSGFLGGALIGLAAVLLLVANGRIAGVSGIAAGLFARITPDTLWRAAFIGGLPLGALVYWLIRGAPPDLTIEASLPVAIAAGLLVGFGTRLGSGCTSGHGVCGIGRLSARSFAAVGVFMATGMAATYVMRHVLA